MKLPTEFPIGRVSRNKFLEREESLVAEVTGRAFRSGLRPIYAQPAIIDGISGKRRSLDAQQRHHRRSSLLLHVPS